MKDEDDIIIKSNDIPEAPEEENKIVGENRISEVEDKKETGEVDEEYKRFRQMQEKLMAEEEDSFDDGDEKVFSLKAQPI